MTATLISTAIPTPSHTFGSSRRRPVRTRNATRMLTTRDASRPSRSPIRAFPSMASSQLTLTYGEVRLASVSEAREDVGNSDHRR